MFAIAFAVFCSCVVDYCMQFCIINYSTLINLDSEDNIYHIKKVMMLSPIHDTELNDTYKS